MPSVRVLSSLAQHLNTRPCVLCSVRTSSGTFLTFQQDETVSAVEDRIAKFSLVPADHGEGLQILQVSCCFSWSLLGLPGAVSTAHALAPCMAQPGALRPGAEAAHTAGESHVRLGQTPQPGLQVVGGDAGALPCRAAAVEAVAARPLQ